MDLGALRAFQQVAEYGGIGSASRAIGVPKTTLSRRLRELEEDLGTRLVDRGPKLFRLTPEGEALHQRTRFLIAEIEEAGQTLSGGWSRPRGKLRVNVPTLFGDLHMGRIASAFLERYPEIDLEVLSDNRVIDPLMEGFDLVVRVNPAADSGLFGRVVFREDTVLVAAPSVPRPRAEAHEDANVSVPAVTLPASAGLSRWIVDRDGASMAYAPRPVLRVSSLPLALQAVRHGTGAALLPRSLVEDDLRAGSLVCWGRDIERVVEVWVLHTSNRLRSPKVTAFVEFLCAAFPDQQAMPQNHGNDG
ncbi:LysR family transcriptional regulator [Sphingomonas sp. KR1UV-12]|uniref:LysR family transcriptional regulator n=1 Tax=Sphingomonas aurea TaxID=3063994 RepID=A0ABT9ELD4_9SPHN|nr:LysR family transcriptional regulator [Sphingomonas sp. KR1UV-12]MDP1027764.1 LysR family transcriptional regulator [Sphingomonas sp. KR1UV-12]